MDQLSTAGTPAAAQQEEPPDLTASQPAPAPASAAAAGGAGTQPAAAASLTAGELPEAGLPRLGGLKPGPNAGKRPQRVRPSLAAGGVKQSSTPAARSRQLQEDLAILQVCGPPCASRTRHRRLWICLSCQRACREQLARRGARPLPKRHQGQQQRRPGSLPQARQGMDAPPSMTSWAIDIQCRGPSRGVAHSEVWPTRQRSAAAAASAAGHTVELVQFWKALTMMGKTSSLAAAGWLHTSPRAL